MIRKVVFLFIFVKYAALQDEEPKKRIGSIIYKGSEDLKAALFVGAEKYKFDMSIRELSRRGEFLEIRNHVCSLANEGVLGIIDGVGGRASEHIQALSDTLDLPHVVMEHNDLYADNWTVLNLYPSPSVYNTVLEEIITKKDWNNFTVLYSEGYSMSRVINLFKMGNDTDWPTVTVRELSGDDYRDVLINAKSNGYTNFVVDCPSRNLDQLLLHAQQVGLMADEHSYIFVSPDIFTLDLDRYRYGGVNMTGLRLTNLTRNELLWNFTSKFNEYTGKPVKPQEFKNKILLAHDAVFVFHEAVRKIQNVTTQELSCEGSNYWTYGTSLLNLMKTNNVTGITGSLAFDGLGKRTNVEFDILELTPSDNQTIARWKYNKLLPARPYIPSTEASEGTIMMNKTFKILIAITPPYGYKKQSVEKLEGNDQYEGFTVDLIDKLADMLGFDYELDVEQDYGSKQGNEWTGMVHALRAQLADFAICDFTITVERQSAVDFSMPFMTLGIGIIYKEPSKQPPELFSFMAVFSNEVWYYMMLVQMGVGIVMIFVGRISHKEWQNPVPCIEQPEELSNQFSFANSMWLIIGSVMQQGSEIAPIAVAPRLITSVWWFFTMVIIASYTGTLVAFLVVEKNVLPFNTVEELAKSSISFGVKKKGSTMKFFEEATTEPFKTLMDKMRKHPNWLVDNNDDGVVLVEKGNYACFMESTSIAYYTQRHCDLLQVGGLIDSKSYGIGMKQGSPYKKFIDDALLKLKEQGEIQKLQDLWWKEKRGGGNCEQAANEEIKQLGMKNMEGAFVVLGVGCVFGLLISILDMLWGVFKRSVKYNTTFKFELIEELKFAIKFSGDVKPVKRGLKTTGESTEALAEAEGKDELRSLRSALSGRSTGTHRTQHSHSSRHSSSGLSGLSVAFARRREYT